MAGIASPPTTYPFTGSIPEQFGIIKSDDGTDLFYRYWPARNLPSKIVVVVLHGIGMHSGPYVTVAAALTPLGIDVYGLDDRGHGKSSGPRDRLSPRAKIVADIHSLIQFVSKINGPEIFLLVP
jgi:alpha-beta hydrolase superfamily lysophospholipase